MGLKEDVLRGIYAYGFKDPSAIQQKGIGERMSGSVAVRKFVGVNSLSIRAIEKILSAPGLAFMDIRKISILCGGPDWPTSVLCGVLHLDLGVLL